MKKFIFVFFMAVLMTPSSFSEKTPLPMTLHQSGSYSDRTKEERTPINLPIAVYYDSDTNIIEVWCDDDNIQAEVYIYDESGTVEAYSPYMNIALQLTSSTSHYILVKGDGWVAEGNL